MAIIFDGKGFAEEKEKILKEKVSQLGFTPKLVSILVGDDKASVLYSRIKKKTAERVGIKFEIKRFSSAVSSSKLIEFIEKLNNEKEVNGIMVQLPLPQKLRGETQTILNSIRKDKDVDGLTKGSLYMPAVVKAVKAIVEYATADLAYFGKKAAVIGAKGMVGEKTADMLTRMGYKVTRCDKNTRDLYAKLNSVDLIVSATGVPGIIKGEVIKEGSIAIDVGAPRGDFEFRSVEPRAGFVTPVPGGVGPVTVASLFENLLEAAIGS